MTKIIVYDNQYSFIRVAQGIVVRKRMERDVIYDNMMLQKIRHCRWENEGWKRSLQYHVQELVQVKNRLSNIVKNEISDEILEIIEFYQNALLEKDVVLQLMRHDVEELFAFTDAQMDEEHFNKYLCRHDKIRKEMLMIEKGLGELKMNFSKSLIEKL